MHLDLAARRAQKKRTNLTSDGHQIQVSPSILRWTLQHFTLEPILSLSFVQKNKLKTGKRGPLTEEQLGHFLGSRFVATMVKTQQDRTCLMLSEFRYSSATENPPAPFVCHRQRMNFLLLISITYKAELEKNPKTRPNPKIATMETNSLGINSTRKRE